MGDHSADKNDSTLHITPFEGEAGSEAVMHTRVCVCVSN